ncbi:hypothetical protein GCM10023156_48360 [Novipirellula rosea]|uniref:Uncharacterized protein n=1 Tax=Novipirellula rosea TaxID=1031540 RepID=A0ABP8N8Z9_9BACT
MVFRGASIEDREIRPNVASQIDAACDKTDWQCKEAAKMQIEKIEIGYSGSGKVVVGGKWGGDRRVMQRFVF